MKLVSFIIVNGVRLSPLGTAATTGLLYQPQMMMVIVEQLVEWRLVGETKVLGENLFQLHLSTTNPT
jgi:urease accessory protein UreF